MGTALPEEAKAMAGPLMGILNQAGGAMFGTQVGQALGGLAGEMLTASDIGLPLGPEGKAALLPANVAGLSSIMVPVVAMVSGAIVHGEPLGALQLVAMACSVGALSLALLKPRPAAGVGG